MRPTKISISCRFSSPHLFAKDRVESSDDENAGDAGDEGDAGGEEEAPPLPLLQAILVHHILHPGPHLRNTVHLLDDEIFSIDVNWFTIEKNTIHQLREF